MKALLALALKMKTICSVMSEAFKGIIGNHIRKRKCQ